MHSLRRPLLLATLALGAPSAVSGACEAALCRCRSAASMGLSEEQLALRHHDAAAAVFLGTITRVDTLATPLGTHRSSVRKEIAVGAGASGAVVARVHVERVWKGVQHDTVTVGLQASADAVSSCDLTVAVGKRYLVFAANRAPGALRTRECSGTARAADAEAALAALGPGVPPRR